LNHRFISPFLTNAPDVENLVSISNWLGVTVATALGVETGTQDDVAPRIALLIEAKARLKQLFGAFVKDYEDGRLTSEDIEDIFAYAAYRIRRKGNTNRPRTEDALPEKTDEISTNPKKPKRRL
jgi:hypothetical protein